MSFHIVPQCSYTLLSFRNACLKYSRNSSAPLICDRHSTAPRYLPDLLHRVADITSRHVSGRRPPLNWSPPVAAWNRRWSVILLHLLSPGSGILCLRTLHLRRLDENWRRICFGNLIRTLYCSLCHLCDVLHGFAPGGPWSYYLGHL